MLNILLTIQIIICVALTAVILLQRSEGGALGMGGGSGGFMTARGAGNLLTRTTAILATLFFIVSAGLTIMGNMTRSSGSVVDRIEIEGLDADQLAPQSPTAPPPAAQVQTPQPAQPSLDALAAPLPGETAAPADTAPAAKK